MKFKSANPVVKVKCACWFRTGEWHNAVHPGTENMLKALFIFIFMLKKLTLPIFKCRLAPIFSLKAVSQTHLPQAAH